MNLSLVAPAAGELISVEDMKTHLRVLEEHEDELIEGYVRAAVGHLDGPNGYLGRCLLNAEWRLSVAAWSGRVALPLVDVSEVAVGYVDTEGEAQTVDPVYYDLVDDSGRVWVQFRSAFAYPSLDADLPRPVSVTFTAGFGDTAEDVPMPIVQSARLLAAHFYQNREAVAGGAMAAIPLGVQTMCAPFRRNFV
ncbi:phage head-tail connector protein [Maritimibacter sp. DP1N21-5]|uniref:head-tail connector protein n=1 Tax=Maritimibacter sp. DP1N21-5 TaxID=2836867 RepID=UPI001C494DF1|nr:phage head-tail connector protein [Maritimibacter sp. DP1N21-5]MBV7408200.1 phage head-tail connector protein [Maritimibacter sp. DP1N21-5]